MDQDSHMPLVSVGIVTYNQKDFLADAIESVLAQDYKNIEIVVADDASTDGTQALLLQYQKDYPGKFVLRLAEQNRGITYNSNAAHFACSGKYIAWMGGDDLMLPDKISKQVAYLEKHPECNIVYHNVDVFESSTGKTIRLYNTNRSKYAGGVKLLIRHGTFNAALANMVRRDKAPAHGFDQELPVASDWYYWIETLRDGGKIGYIDEVLARHRRHTENVTNKNSAFYRQAINDHLKTLEKVKVTYGNYNREAGYRESAIYNDARHINYLRFLIKSLKANFLNVKSWAYLSVYVLTFGKVKY